MIKFKQLCISISRQQKKLFWGTIIAYVILFIAKGFSIIKPDFVSFIGITLLVLYEIFRDLSHYDTDTIMKNNFLYILLSSDSPIMFIICFLLIYIFKRVLNTESIGVLIILGLLDIVISIILTTKINRYFKRKIKINDSTSD